MWGEQGLFPHKPQILGKGTDNRKTDRKSGWVNCPEGNNEGCDRKYGWGLTWDKGSGRESPK